MKPPPSAASISAYPSPRLASEYVSIHNPPPRRTVVSSKVKCVAAHILRQGAAQRVGTSLAWHKDTIRSSVRVSVLCKLTHGGASSMRVAGHAPGKEFYYSQKQGSFAVLASHLWHASVPCRAPTIAPVMKLVFFFE